jgi:hypothetical protein
LRLGDGGGWKEMPGLGLPYWLGLGDGVLVLGLGLDAGVLVAGLGEGVLLFGLGLRGGVLGNGLAR